LWQTGNATAGQWRAEMTTNRQLFADQRLGIAVALQTSRACQGSTEDDP
jgi:hypothetical protein